MQAVIADRLARLSPSAATTAGVGVAIGQAFTADVLAAATGLDEHAFVAALDELWRRGIVRAHGPNAYDFSHGRPERRRAHVLRYGQDPELLVRLRLAHMLWLLGQPAEADRQRDLALQAASESSHAHSRAAAEVWAAIVAIDRGEVAEFRRHARALAVGPADEGSGRRGAGLAIRPPSPAARLP